MRPLDSVRTLGRPIAYHSSLAKHVGGVTAAIFLSQLMYWDERSKSELGVHKTAEEWELETGLSYREQAGARKKLRELGLLIETEQRLQHRIYYKLDHDSFNEFMERIFSEEFANDDNAIPERRKRNSGATKAQPADEQKRNPSNDENAIRYIDIDYTETTTETTDIYTPKPPADEKPKKKPRPTVNKKDLIADGVDEQVAEEYLYLRQQRRARLTPLALTRIKNEADKAGVTLNHALLTCIERGWQSFKAEWIAERKNVPRQQERFDPVEYINRNRISKQLPKMEELDVIDC